MISSVRSAFREYRWLRFVVLFAIVELGAFRHELLHGIGYADAGWPRWIFAAIVAASFVVYLDLSGEDSVWLPVAGRSRGVRIAYSAFFLGVCGVFLTAIWAHAPFRSPVLLVSGALFVPLCVIDVLARRKQARARKAAVDEDEADLIPAK